MIDFDAVVFDVDGTLYENRHMYLRSLPFAVRHPRLIAAFSAVRRRIRKLRPIDDFYRLQAELLAEELGKEPQEARRLIDATVYRKWESLLDGIPLSPGVEALLHYLREDTQLKLGVLSDFPIERKLRLIGLENGWDVTLSSEEIGYLKPNPEPFEEVAGRLGTPPERVLYVGNSYRYDVLGSKAIGMLCAHFTRKQPRESRADLSFGHFRELHGWILSHQEYT